MNLFFERVLYVFDWIQIGVMRRPIDRSNPIFFQPRRRTPLDVHSSVILHKHIVGFVIWKQIFLEDVAIIPRSNSFARRIRIAAIKDQFGYPLFAVALLYHSLYHNGNGRFSMIIRVHKILTEAFGRVAKDPLTRVIG